MFDRLAILVALLGFIVTALQMLTPAPWIASFISILVIVAAFMAVVIWPLSNPRVNFIRWIGGGAIVVILIWNLWPTILGPLGPPRFRVSLAASDCGEDVRQIETYRICVVNESGNFVEEVQAHIMRIEPSPFPELLRREGIPLHFTNDGDVTPCLTLSTTIPGKSSALFDVVEFHPGIEKPIRLYHCFQHVKIPQYIPRGEYKLKIRATGRASDSPVVLYVMVGLDENNNSYMRLSSDDESPIGVAPSSPKPVLPTPNSAQ